MTARRLPLGQVALIAAIDLAAALLWTLVFDTSDLLPGVLVAVVATTVASVVLAAVKGSPHSAASLLVALVALAVTLTVVTKGVDPALWRGGLAHGWSDILSATVPAPGQPELLVFPVFLAWLATLVSVEVTLRTGAEIAPVLPATALAAAAYLFALDGPGRNSWQPVVFLAAVGTVLLLRGSMQPGSATEPEDGEEVAGEVVSAAVVRRRRIFAGIPLAAVLAVISVLLGSVAPFLSAEEPLQIRDHWTTDDRLEPMVNPLGQVTVAATTSDQPTKIFTVKLDKKLDRPAQFRLLVLDTFDQIEWTARPHFVAVGRRVPAESSGAAKSITVHQSFRIDQLAGSWLPALDRPDTVDAPLGADLKVETDTGAIARGRGGPKQLSYSVTSEVPDVDFGAIASDASPATGSDADRALQLPPSIPASFQKIKEQVSAKGSSSWQQLARLIGFFDPKQQVKIDDKVIDFHQDPETTLGHSLGALDRFVTTQPGGTSEQFATAFAVLARMMKFPTRVVVGYVSTTAGAGRSVDVMSNELQAWPEVKLAGHGWVPIPFDFTSSSTSTVEVPAEVAAAVTETNAPDQPPTTRVLPPVTCPHPHQPGVPDCPPAADPGLGWVGVLVIVAIVLLFLAVVVSLPAWVKRLRRRRRATAGTPADRIAGAWQEVLDRLREAGIPNVHTLVPAEVARASREDLGLDSSDHVTELGVIVQRALHAPAEPVSEDATAAWDAEQRFESDLDDVRSISDRVRVAVDPRPLLASGKASGR